MNTLLLVALACFSPETGSPEGTWSTDFGSLEIVQTDGVLAGTYPGGSISGGEKKQGHWYFHYQDTESSGTARFRVEQDRLVGAWQKQNTVRWRPWNGVRAAISIEGTWSTNFGALRIIAADEGWEGLYGDGVLQDGRREGETWRFRYVEGDARGFARFEVNGDILRGAWREQPTDAWKAWEGTRVAPSEQPYLVILEAPWEADFGEQPYSFASMLKGHFQMTDQVIVRSMQVHDSDDIARACRGVALMTAPVYLLISSHGTPRGLTMNGVDIPAAAFRDLKYCENLRLLHLSGCSMLKGDHYQEIRRSAGTHFPISGYKIEVPWTASALSDYFYLTQIFVHGASPAEAVKRTHKLIPYSHTTTVLPEYPAMGLSIR